MKNTEYTVSEKNTCIDFYGERLKIGDKVIPLLSEALIIGAKGTISKIVYSEALQNSYITIVDQNGNVLLNNVDSRCYSTQERFDDRENFDCVYSLVFFTNTGFPLTSLPLTNRTDPDYQFPDRTCYIALNSHHLSHIGARREVIDRKTKRKIIEDCGDSYSSSYEFYFAVKNKVKFHDNKRDEHYLEALETNYRSWTGKYHKLFYNEEELKIYIRETIKFFNQADLSYVHNKKVFHDNEEGNAFERTLIQQLDKK